MRLVFDPSRPIYLRGEIFGPSGSRAVTLLLDTGAIKSMIRPDRLARIGVAPDQSFLLITTASGVEPMRVARIPMIEIAGQRIEDFAILAHELPATARIDGLLGMDFLQGLHLSIRMRRGVLTLEEDDDA